MDGGRRVEVAGRGRLGRRWGEGRRGGQGARGGGGTAREEGNRAAGWGAGMGWGREGGWLGPVGPEGWSLVGVGVGWGLCSVFVVRPGGGLQHKQA